VTMTLRELATEQLDVIAGEYGSPDDRDQAIARMARHLVGRGQVPDNILEAMPEISRHNDPQVSPQQYACGCVAMTRITDRNSCSWLGRLEEPFEMRLAIPCDGTACELAHLRAGSNE
jgi:hypothetical protein